MQVDGHMQEHLALAKKPLLATNKIKLPGRHNIINALAALSIGHAAGFEMQGMLKAIENFQGLEHRCQWVANKQGVDYFNDSKGTNVGATVAALEGLGATLATDKKIVLIAGGDGKGADFDDLVKPVARFVKAVILIGADAKKIAASVAGAQIHYATDMQDAVRQAAALASAEEIVLLSPACASFDMFANYEQRGHVFSDLARKL